ncbi:hypothetical protein [Vagococcus lutrae]|uniref:hypothetical protein n=1 Tax=Vagococcus lutrae TaxID=81947 RepID=UPI00288FB1A4|nr:hypothetical protein [Vagococcus lutrae]MDT2844777.1 hypothetical protein [Vagococcus lutrae]
MTNGASQGLFVIVAVVIFGIFVLISYVLFRDTLKPNLANIFTDSLEQANKNLNNEKSNLPSDKPEDSKEDKEEDSIDWTKYYKFNKENGHIEGVTSAFMTEMANSEIIVPSEIDGVKVNTIESYTFSRVDGKYRDNYIYPSKITINAEDYTLETYVFSGIALPNFLDLSGASIIQQYAIALFYKEHENGNSTILANGAKTLTVKLGDNTQFEHEDLVFDENNPEAESEMIKFYDKNNDKNIWFWGNKNGYNIVFK